MYTMYSSLPNFVLGFHGCDLEIGNNVVAGKDRLTQSENDYDWLGHGIYFWENNPQRALEYATTLKENPKRTLGKVNTPAVLGAIIDLGYCLDLFEASSLILVKKSYELLCSSKMELPENKPANKSADLLLRYLDCLVIETLHSYNADNNYRDYDTVRSGFNEGKDLYPNSGFKEKNHIQICVRNPNCIKGYFIPLMADDEYRVP